MLCKPWSSLSHQDLGVLNMNRYVVKMFLHEEETYHEVVATDEHLAIELAWADIVMSAPDIDDTEALRASCVAGVFIAVPKPPHNTLNRVKGTTKRIRLLLNDLDELLSEMD